MLVLNYAVEAKLRRKIMPGDHMYAEANPGHYFSVGASAMQCIASAAIAAGHPGDFTKVLDFACGSGRVTRWLRAAFPAARVVASDLRADSLDWIAANLGAEPWLSAKDIGSLQPPCRFDLIWCGSLVTHLSEDATRGVLSAFARWLAPNGIAVVSTHGRRTVENQRNRPGRYLPEELFAPVGSAYAAQGYGYADYPGRADIGFSVCSPAWIAQALMGIDGVRLVALTETAWDNHHDIVAFQRGA